MVHRFGAFWYDSAQRLLFRNGETISLVPKAIDTLHALLERRGQLVAKTETSPAPPEIRLKDQIPLRGNRV